MTLTRIYCPIFLQENALDVLPSAAAHHVLQVLRHRVGDKIAVFNPEQGEFLAEIIHIARKEVTVRMLTPIDRHTESALKIHLGQAISRSERMDFALQKAVELGVSAITPVITTRCNVKLDAMRMDKRVDHWQKIVISACEQCGRVVIPKVNPPEVWTTWLGLTQGFGIVCAPEVAVNPLPLRPTLPIKLLIGPEGGLSINEVNEARDYYQCSVMSLGPRILRTETATIVALTLLQQCWGDMGLVCD